MKVDAVDEMRRAAFEKHARLGPIKDVKLRRGMAGAYRTFSHLLTNEERAQISAALWACIELGEGREKFDAACDAIRKRLWPQ